MPQSTNMFRPYDSDHAGSEDMDDILEMSLLEHQNTTKEAKSGPSGAQPSYLHKHDLNSRVSALDIEIQDIDEQIQKLRAVQQALMLEKEGLLRQCQLLSQPGSSAAATCRAKGKCKAVNNTIDYSIEFDWAPELKSMMKVFGINNFRLCQQGVCNANLDGRDVVCVMPTGGGKSLTYQLPALLTPGCTLVVSPLISLITDQILHLREAGVEAVMLTGGTPKAQASEIQQRLTAMASSRGGGQRNPEIKLCYVTPEKISKNKGFMSLLRKLVEGGKLARIVIDEAHCVSQLGHDFRPDYKKLSALRQFFPNVPILALSATCPPMVLKDILKILHMEPTVDGKAAPQDGTVYFSAPLYRKNLHYSILPKPSSSKELITTMSNYILSNHNNESGIVYCLTKKDAETVAENLQSWSNNKIKTGVYHADIPDVQKEILHKRWREGVVQVVCATIAFGLGIDKGNISKSLDGYYQESGRAGRDGQDADCVLYYRPQDATRQSSITCTDKESQAKLHDMLRFAQDMQECRKILFAKYFSASSDLCMLAWTTEESHATERCGHCDNCLRQPGTFVHQDVTLAAWQILKILETVHTQGGRQTIAGLGDLTRGLGGGTYDTSGKRRNTKTKEQLDYGSIAGGKVELSKDDVETLIVHLLVSNYVGEAFSSTAYAINVYVIPGNLAIRLTRFTRAEIVNGLGPRIHCSFRRIPRKGKGKATASTHTKVTTTPGDLDLDDSNEETVVGPSNSGRLLTRFWGKKKRPHEEAVEELAEVESGEDFTEKIRMIDDSSDADDDIADDLDWEYSMRPMRQLKKRRMMNGKSKEASVEVISLSSD